jgi:predicted transcriptional regulator
MLWKRDSDPELMSGLKRRSHVELHAVILRLTSTDSLTANQILIVANLNRKLVTLCIDELTRNGFLQESDKDQRTFSATREGIHWLKRYEGVMDADRKKS